MNGAIFRIKIDRQNWGTFSFRILYYIFLLDKTAKALNWVSSQAGSSATLPTFRTTSPFCLCPMPRRPITDGLPDGLRVSFQSLCHC